MNQPFSGAFRSRLSVEQLKGVGSGESAENGGCIVQRDAAAQEARHPQPFDEHADFGSPVHLVALVQLVDLRVKHAQRKDASYGDSPGRPAPAGFPDGGIERLARVLPGLCLLNPLVLDDPAEIFKYGREQGTSGTELVVHRGTGYPGGTGDLIQRQLRCIPLIEEVQSRRDDRGSSIGNVFGPSPLIIAAGSGPVRAGWAGRRHREIILFVIHCVK